MEKDNENFEGSYDFGGRSIYDSRLARFISVDPDDRRYSYMSPYCFAANNPIRLIDKGGKGPGDPLTVFACNDYDYVSTCMYAQLDLYYKKLEAEDKQFKRTPYKASYIVNSGLSYESLTKYNTTCIALRMAMLTVKDFQGTGHDWGARNLNRYLLGKGGYDIYAYSFLYQNTGFRTGLGTLERNLKSYLVLKEGQTVVVWENFQTTTVCPSF